MTPSMIINSNFNIFAMQGEPDRAVFAPACVRRVYGLWLDHALCVLAVCVCFAYVRMFTYASRRHGVTKYFN